MSTRDSTAGLSPTHSWGPFDHSSSSVISVHSGFDHSVIICPLGGDEFIMGLHFWCPINYSPPERGGTSLLPPSQKGGRDIYYGDWDFCSPPSFTLHLNHSDSIRPLGHHQSTGESTQTTRSADRLVGNLWLVQFSFRLARFSLSIIILPGRGGGRLYFGDSGFIFMGVSVAFCRA